MTYRYRSAISGHFVSAAHAKRHPRTTVREMVKPKPFTSLSEVRKAVKALKKRKPRPKFIARKIELRGKRARGGYSA